MNSVKISDGAMLPRCHDDATSVTGRVARSIVLIHCSRWATELNTEGDAHVADMSFVQRSDDRPVAILADRTEDEDAYNRGSKPYFAPNGTRLVDGQPCRRGRHAKIFGWAKSAAYDRRYSSDL